MNVVLASMNIDQEKNNEWVCQSKYGTKLILKEGDVLQSKTSQGKWYVARGT